MDALGGEGDVHLTGPVTTAAASLSVVAHAGVAVLTTRVLWDSITAFMSGYPYQVYRFSQERDIASLRASLRDKSEENQGLVGDPTQKGVLPHLAIAADDPKMLRVFFKLSRHPQYWQDLKLSFRKVMCCAVLYNRVEMLECICELKSGDPGWQWEPLLMRLAIDRDDPSVHVLEWLRQRLPLKATRLFERDMLRHMERGDLDVVRWLLQHKLSHVSRRAMEQAAKWQQVRMLRLFYEHTGRRCRPGTLYATAGVGHLEIVTFIVENQERKGAYGRSLSYAAFRGQLEVVKYFVKSKLQIIAPRVIDYAAEGGHLDIVKYLHENFADGGCKTQAMDAAAKAGRLDIVKFLHDHRNEGCSSDALDRAASNGHLEVVKFLHDNYHLECSPEAIDETAANGHLDVLKFVHYNCCTKGCTTEAMDRAADNGRLEIVKFLHFNRTEGCTAKAMKLAIMRGFYEIVEFLTEYRTECDIVTALKEAVVSRQLEIVKLLCPKLVPGQSAYPAVEAASQGWSRSEIAKYLCEHVDQEPTKFLIQAVDNAAYNVVHAVWWYSSLEELESAEKYALEQEKLEIAAIITDGIRTKTYVQQSEPNDEHPGRCETDYKH